MPGKRLGLIVAGGTGARMNEPIVKQLIALQGKPILIHTIERFLDFDPEMTICLSLHASVLEKWQELKAAFFATLPEEKIVVCAGGENRVQSVHKGLEKLEKSISPDDRDEALVGIHDGVRPFVNRELLSNAYQIAGEQENAIVSVPVKSSIRKKTDQGSESVDRSSFYHVQTPQVFRFQQILEIYRNRSGDGFTDDSGLAEAAGMKIHLAPGSYDNIKITTPEDLLLAELILKKEN